MRTILFLLCLFNTTHSLANTLEKIKKRGSIIIGLEPGFMPFEMQTTSGEMIGFDVRMMRAFAADLNVKADFVTSKWDGIIPGLMARKYDLIVSGMTITPERQRAVLFSDPYYNAGLKVLINPQMKDKIKDLKTLDQKGVTVAVKLGTTGDIFAKKNFKHAKIRRMDTEADAAQAVLLGRVEAFIYDKPYLELYHSAKKPKVLLLADSVSEEQFGVAARKKDKELIARFNTFLKKWRADKKDGYDKAYQDIFVDMVWKSKFPNLF